MRRLLVIVAFSVLSAPLGAYAFGTISSLGQHAEHERITRAALRPFRFGQDSLSELAGKRGTFGAVGAPDNPVRGLISKPAAHCDGGDALAVSGYPQSAAAAIRQLDHCRKWIFAHLEKAVRYAGALVDRSGRVNTSEIPSFISCVYNGKAGRAKCNVFGALGLAFHAAQDFYSHTNWTDRAADGATSATNPPGLNQNGRASWLDPRKHQSVPTGLISGCFQGIPESRHCTDGDGKPRVRHAALNKDKGLIDPRSGKARGAKTPRGRINGNFARAVAAAIADTRDKWAYFEARVKAVYGRRRGNTIVCALKSDAAESCR